MVIQHTGELEGIKAAVKVFLQAAWGTAVLGGPGEPAGSGFGCPYMAEGENFGPSKALREDFGAISLRKGPQLLKMPSSSPRGFTRPRWWQDHM